MREKRVPALKEWEKCSKMTKDGIYRQECVAGMGVRPHTPVCGRTLKCAAAHSMFWSVWPDFA